MYYSTWITWLLNFDPMFYEYANCLYSISPIDDENSSFNIKNWFQFERLYSKDSMQNISYDTSGNRYRCTGGECCSDHLWVGHIFRGNSHYTNCERLQRIWTTTKVVLIWLTTCEMRAVRNRLTRIKSCVTEFYCNTLFNQLRFNCYWCLTY